MTPISTKKSIVVKEHSYEIIDEIILSILNILSHKVVIDIYNIDLKSLSISKVSVAPFIGSTFLHF